MEQGGAEEITDRGERGGGRGEMRSEGGRYRGGEEIRKLYKYLKEIQKWGDFYQRVGEGKCSKKRELLPKKEETGERGGEERAIICKSRTRQTFLCLIVFHK